MKIDVVAKRYAFAFFSEVKNVEIFKELDSIATLAKESVDFASVIKSPVIDHEEKLAVFKSLKDSRKISQELFNFIALLIEKKRLFLLTYINDEVIRLIRAEKGELLAEVVFAKEIDEQVTKDLKDKLSKLTGRKVVLHKVIDKSVIGGVRVQIGSTLYDATIKGQLDKMRAALHA